MSDVACPLAACKNLDAIDPTTLVGDTAQDSQADVEIDAARSLTTG